LEILLNLFCNGVLSRTGSIIKELVEVARLLKISRQNVCNIEKGRWLPSPDLIEKFALKLGYSPTVFLKFYFDEILKKMKMGKYTIKVTKTKAG